LVNMSISVSKKYADEIQPQSYRLKVNVTFSDEQSHVLTLTLSNADEIYL